MGILAILMLAQAAGGGLDLAACTVPGSAEAVRCGTLSVPEDPGRPDGRHIALRVVVVPALDPDPAHAPLTPRERVVMQLLCEGRSNAQIAWALGIAEKTVRNHVSGVYRKLGVRSRAEAIVRAYRPSDPAA